MKRLKRYWKAVLGGAIIAVFFFAIPALLSFSFYEIFIAIGGLLFSIPIRYGWDIFKRPVLKIEEKIESRGFDIKFLGEDGPKWGYVANRIIVKNIGRSAAKNCKGWIVSGESKERVHWMVPPKERVDATINVKDDERLDFCAYYKKGPKEYPPAFEKSPKTVSKIIVSDENGFPTDSIDSAWIKSIKKVPFECRLLVTSENAEAKETKIIFNENEIKVETIKSNARKRRRM